MDTNPASTPAATSPAAGSPAVAPPVTAEPTAAEVKRARRLRIGAEALPTRVPWRAVVVYIVIAFALAWLAVLPIWLAGGIEAVDTNQFMLLLTGMMFTPTVAALVVVFAVQRPKRPLTMLGLRFRPAGRTLLFMTIAWFVPPVLVFLGVLLAGAIGALSLDFTFEAYRQVFLEAYAALDVLPDQIQMMEELPASTLVLMALMQMITISVLFSSITAFGEELGWRGWLLPALRPLGTWPAIVISCIVWGLWHAPIILLGYNFMDRTPMGLVFMVGFCLSIGIFCSWVRLRSATVYPAAITHGSINASFAVIAPVLAGDVSSADPRVALVGWTSWIPFLVFGLLVLVLRQFRRQPLPGLTLAESAVALEAGGVRGSTVAAGAAGRPGASGVPVVGGADPDAGADADPDACPDGTVDNGADGLDRRADSW